ncbi:MAG: tetratricopeptide repeat protein [Acidobacteriota bacterium]
MMSSPERKRCVPLLVFAAGVMLCALPATFAQENNQRCEGTVTDPDGNPLRGVKITFYDESRNLYAQPVKTNKKGHYAHNFLRANSNPGWLIKASLEGYLIVQIKALTQIGDGTRVTDETYMVGKTQEGIHKVAVSAQSRRDLASHGKCVVDFVMAKEGEFLDVFQRLRAEKMAAEGKTPEATQAAPGAPGAPAAAAPSPAAPSPAAPSRSPLETAMAAIEEGRWEDAVEPARKAVADDPDDATAQRWLGAALLKTNDLAGAAAALKKAHELDPTIVGLNFDLGTLYIQKGRLMQAIPYFEQENELVPDTPAVLQNLGKLYVDTEQYAKAAEVYDQLVDLEPDKIEHYGMLASVYKKMGKTDKERETYERMGEQDPSGMAFYNLGTLMFNKDEMQQAATAYQKAIEQSPDNGLAHYQLALTYIHLTKFKEAIAELETFIKLEPKSPKAKEAKSLVADLKKMAG